MAREKIKSSTNENKIVKYVKENYKPYLDLLKAVCNSDDEETFNSSCIVVYDMFDNEKLIAVFSKLKYCANFFNTSIKTIDSYISKGCLRNRRYKIERVYFKEEK